MGEARQRKLLQETNVPIIRPRAEVKFRPVLDRIFVEEIPVRDRIVTLGGIIVGDQSHSKLSKKSMTGKVLAVGDGVPMGGILMPMPYKVGDVVRCSEYGREYINLETGQNGETSFQKDEVRTFLIRVADTHGVLGDDEPRLSA
jgi:co-chaperonin GroES (HSP10)